MDFLPPRRHSHDGWSLAALPFLKKKIEINFSFEQIATSCNGKGNMQVVLEAMKMKHKVCRATESRITIKGLLFSSIFSCIDKLLLSLGVYWGEKYGNNGNINIYCKMVIKL